MRVGCLNMERDENLSKFSYVRKFFFSCLEISIFFSLCFFFFFFFFLVVFFTF